ncbi:hypothetical protein V6N13_023445 [Hibiscus sabdariffa]|uniref:Uncharacterized protein n=2 Tax=Hibiscus sabdariffa TaxID=183260 RepID=A0ABR2PLU9_9ROSI
MLAHVSDSQIVVSTNSNVDQVKRLYSALWSLAISTKIKLDKKRMYYLWIYYGGYIMAAGSIPHRFVPSPEVAEAYAYIDALMLARDAGFNSIHSMRAFFTSLTFSHVGRTCNAVAHLLAREGRDFPGPRFWVEEAPPSVEEAALKDKRWVDLQN